MSKTLLKALAATILLGGMLGNHAAAMTLAAPSGLNAAAARTALVEHTTSVCGNTGCVQVQTSRVRRPKTNLAAHH